MCVRSFHVKIYDGELGRATDEFDSNLGPALHAVLAQTYWQYIKFGGCTYYQTFEYHIYRINMEDNQLTMPIRVPDILGPEAQLCWHQGPTMERCDRRLDHKGPHSWQCARAACVWSRVGKPGSKLGKNELWSSGCGADWQFDTGGPVEHHVRWCPFCGGEVAIAG